MVKVVANGYKITYSNYVIEIDTSESMTHVYRRAPKVGAPLKKLYSFDNNCHIIDCLFKAMNYTYEYNKRSNKPM